MSKKELDSMNIDAERLTDRPTDRPTEVDYIRNGNCLDLLREMPDEVVDLTVTSPPYDNLRTYSGYEFDFKGIAKELYRVTKKGGVVVWIVNDAVIDGSKSGTSFRQALYFQEIGFNIHDVMIWKKDSCAFPEKTRYYPNFEYMFVFSKGKPKTVNLIADRKNKWAGMNVHGTFRNPDGTTTDRSTTWKSSICKDYGIRFNVWEIPSAKNNTTGHPAVFPLRLAADHINTWSNKGDIVLDPFLGSGTTVLAAISTGRHFIGFEISEKYFKATEERIRQEKSQMSIFDFI